MSKLKGFIGDTLVYGFGNVFSRLFAMLLIPLYAKYLGKIDYSNLVMLQSTFSILTFLTALNAGVFFYYYEYDNLRYRKIVLTSWFYYQIAVSVIIITLLITVSPCLSQVFIINAENSESLRWALILIGLQLIPFIFNNTNINFYRIERKPFPVVFIVSLEAIFTLILVFIVLQFSTYGLLGVVFCQLIARFLVTLIFIKKSLFYILIKNFSLKLLKKMFSYSWPFILSMVFTWVIITIDKFIGAQKLTDKTEVALLALAMQLVLPISVLADMIRMALGPYVMSIRKDAEAEKSYQQIFDLTIFSSSVVVISIVLFSPLLTYLLADLSYIGVINVIPLMAFASVLSLAGNQFCISFNLVKKNIYIFWSILIAGLIGTIINLLLMKRFGYVVSGYSQIASYIAMAAFLYFYGKRIANLQTKLRNSLFIIAELVGFIILLYFVNPLIINGQYFIFFLCCFSFILLMSITYIKLNKINFVSLSKNLIKTFFNKK